MKRKKINLALQGGGAHGAFTWGVLDLFLESQLFTIEGISATSAGAMNAVVLTQGMLENGEDGARQALFNFWRTMSDYGRLFNVTATMPVDLVLSPLLKRPINFFLFSTMINSFSPYQFNPTNFHPIREVLSSLIKIDKIRKQKEISLFICATNINTGKIRIFNNKELTIDAIIASACLPKLFQAVEIDKEYYWDGGYLGNPAMFPLIYNTESRDIIVLHTVPIHRDERPTDTMEIDTRLREISFNSSLMREMRAIAFVSKLIEKKWIKNEYRNRLKHIYMHCLRADNILKNFSLASVYSPDWDFLMELHHLGREAGKKWLDKNFKFIGKKATVDFQEWL